jgi:hypothetical protein
MKYFYHKPTKDSWEFFILPVIAITHNYDAGDYIVIAWLLWAIVIEYKTE